MSEVEPVQYLRCYTCGRYFPGVSAQEERFCCRDCLEGYLRCPACGEYFPARDDRFKGFCSEPCRHASEDKIER